MIWRAGVYKQNFYFYFYFYFCFYFYFYYVSACYVPRVFPHSPAPLPPLTGTAVGDPSPSHRSVPSRVVTGRGLGTVTGG